MKQMFQKNVLSLARLIIDPEVVGDTFPRNVGSHADYTALSAIQPGRPNS
jgi:hypothetical protein